MNWNYIKRKKLEKGLTNKMKKFEVLFTSEEISIL